MHESTISELCNDLESIDVVNFEKFDLSCFELAAGSSFEDSTIKNGQQTSLDRDSDGKTN